MISKALAKFVWASFMLFASVITISVQAVTIDLVPVGNPGNANDSAGHGAVAYNYWIGKYEVTNDQYCEFLNEKANLSYGSNVLGLFNPAMQSSARGGIYRTGSGTVDNPYAYHVKDLMSNKPVGYVGVFDGMRFVNWLNNGAGSGDTENGAYLLTGATAVPSNATTIFRNPGATVFLPSEDEWHKAAYYEPGHGYWSYGTRSDLPPAWAVADSQGDVANPGANIANYGYHFAWNGQTGNVSTVGGAGPLSESYYGAADMTGNQEEFTETHFQGNLNKFVFRGGCWGDGISFQLRGNSAAIDGGNDIDPAWGFRVASFTAVPEPGSIALLATGAIVSLLVCGWQRRRK
jgi:formylglycine-generating enzyme